MFFFNFISDFISSQKRGQTSLDQTAAAQHSTQKGRLDETGFEWFSFWGYFFFVVTNNCHDTQGDICPKRSAVNY